MLPEREPGKGEIAGARSAHQAPRPPANGASGRRRRTGRSMGLRIVCRLAPHAARV